MVRHGQMMPKAKALLSKPPRLRKVPQPRIRPYLSPPPKPPSQRSSQLPRSQPPTPPHNLQPRSCRSETPSPRQARIIQLLSPRMESFGSGAATRNFNSDIRRAMRKTMIRRSSWTMLRVLLSVRIFRLLSKITGSFGRGVGTIRVWSVTRMRALPMDSLPQSSWTMSSAFRLAIVMPPPSSATGRFGRGATIRMASWATGRLTTAPTMSQKR